MSYWDYRHNQTKPSQWSSNDGFILDCVKPMIKTYNKVFDFGCGDGEKYQFLKSISNEYVGYDISSVAILKALNRFPDINVSINFNEKERFDLIYCSFVLQHIMTDDELLERLKQFRLMLNRNGNMLIIDNISKKSNLGYMIFRSEFEHELLFEMACFEIAESKLIKIDNEDVKIWRLI